MLTLAVISTITQPVSQILPLDILGIIMMKCKEMKSFGQIFEFLAKTFLITALKRENQYSLALIKLNRLSYSMHL